MKMEKSTTAMIRPINYSDDLELWNSYRGGKK